MQEAKKVTGAPEMSRSRRRVRTLTRAVVAPTLLAGAVFGATYYGSNVSASSSLEGTQQIDYYEECTKEGCSNEEIKELWSSYQSECFDEGCWTEEVFELAGGSGDHWAPYNYPSKIPSMFTAFRNRLGKRFDPAPMRPGYTETLWTKLVDFLDGKTITVVSGSCDPDFECNVNNPWPG